MEKLTDDVWKLNVDSNVYCIKDKILIDTGPPSYRNQVKEQLSTIVDKIEKVIFTHLHYDHIGNFDLFPNAKFFASKEEIEFFEKNRISAILNPFMAKRFNVSLHPLEKLEGFRIFKTPGHTQGSICLLYEKDKILFTGDTLFLNGHGRVDFPGASPSEMEKSLDFVSKLKYNILAPGHDY